MKRIACLFLTLTLIISTMSMAFAASPSVADLLRYVPTRITVNGGEVKVEGYFVNMSSRRIAGFKNGEIELEIYLEDDVLIKQATFTGSNLRDLNLRAYSMTSWTFTWTDGGWGLNNGTYVMDSDCYALFNCTVQYE